MSGLVVFVLFTVALAYAGGGMSLGGLLLIGITVVMACFDGALSTLVFAAVVAFIGYVVVRRLANSVPQKILATQKSILERQLADEIEKVRREQASAQAKPGADVRIKALVAENKERVDALTQKLETQRWGNREMATLVGAGLFACPWFALPMVAAATSQRWWPLLGGLVDAVDHMTALPERGAGYFVRTGVLHG